MSKITEAAA